jgi:hypothetical protein
MSETLSNPSRYVEDDAMRLLRILETLEDTYGPGGVHEPIIPDQDAS